MEKCLINDSSELWKEEIVIKYEPDRVGFHFLLEFVSMIVVAAKLNVQSQTCGCLATAITLHSFWLLLP